MPNPSPTRVAFQHLKEAGGSGFSNYAKGTDPKKLFRELREDAKHNRGHGGYTGTIAEKNGFTLRSRTPMSPDAARDFVGHDIDRNDKHGPAFAIPVASVKVLGEKKYTVKVKAKNHEEAVSEGKKAIAAKGRERAGTTVEVLIGYGGVKQLAAGGVPTVSTTKLSNTYFTVNNYGRFRGKKEAVAHVKGLLTGPNEWEKQPGTGYLIAKIGELSLIKVTGEASKLPTWEVTGVRKQVAMGKTEGYIFYGIASS